MGLKHVALTARARGARARIFPLLAALAAGVWAAVAGGCFAEIDESRIPHSGASDAALADGGASQDGDAPYLGVPCGDAACAPPVSVCCASSFGDTDSRRGACSTRDTCGTGDYFACTSDRDCAYVGSAGPSCCVIRLKGGAFTQTACQASCGALDELCSPGGAACPTGKACRASLEFPILFQCAAN